MLELALEKGIALLAVRERQSGDILFLGIVVDIDVLARHRAPLEVVVLDLVFAEGDGLRADVLDKTAENESNDESESEPAVLHFTTSKVMMASSRTMRSAMSRPATTRPNMV
jgi:hypothetical protein